MHTFPAEPAALSIHVLLNSTHSSNSSSGNAHELSAGKIFSSCDIDLAVSQ